MLCSPAAGRPSDEQLARRAQQGCAESFDQLVRRFQVPVLQFLRQRSGPADAEDLAQDTFVRAYENLHRYRRTWRFATWLFTIARRVSINHYRRARPSIDGQACESLESRSPGPHQAVVDEEDRRHLWAVAAEVLSEEQMSALWLHYVEQMPLRQVAGVLRCSRVAVKTMMHRARKKLLPLLRELDSDGSPRPEAASEKRKSTWLLTAKEVTHV